MLAVPLPEAEVRAAAPGDACRSPRSTPPTSASSPVRPTTSLPSQTARTTDEVTPTLIPLAAAGAQLAARPDPARVPRGRPTGRAVAAADAVPVEPHRHVDHGRAGHRPAVLGRPPAPHGALRRLPAHAARRRTRSCSSSSGPGHSLSSYARRQAVKPTAAIPALRHPNQVMDDTAYTLLAFARGWAAGVDVDLDRFAGDGPPPGAPARLPVPQGAPLDRAGRRRHRRPAPSRSAPTRRPPPRRPPSPPTSRSAHRRPRRLVLGADVGRAGRRSPPPPRRSARGSSSATPTDPFVAALARDLTRARRRRRGHAVAASGLAHRGPVRRARRPDGRLRRRRRALADDGVGGRPGPRRRRRRADAARRRHPRRHRRQRHGRRTRPTRWRSASSARPHASTSTCARRSSTSTRAATPSTDAAAVVGELFGASDQVVARRGLRRLVPTTERAARRPVPADAVTFRRGGNYLVTGGLGGVGFALARHLAARPRGQPRRRRQPAGAGGRRAQRVARPPRLRRPDEPAHPPPRRARGARHEGHRRRRRPRRSRRRCAAARRGGRAPRRPPRRRDPRRRRAARPPDRAGHPRGPRGRRRRQGPRRARPRSTSCAAAAPSCSCWSRRRRPCSCPTARPPTSPPTACSTRSPAPHGDLRVVTDQLRPVGRARHRRRQRPTASRLGIEAGDPVDPPGAVGALPTSATARSASSARSPTGHHWVVDEHRTSTGIALLPGTGHLELFLAALDARRARRRRARAGHAARAARRPRRRAGHRPRVDHRARRRPLGAARERRRRRRLAPAQRGRARRRARPAPPVATSPARPDGAADVDPLARPASQLELGPRWTPSSRRGATATTVGGRLRLAEPYARRARRVAGPPGPRRRRHGVRRAARRARAVAVRPGRLRRGHAAAAALPASPWVRATRQPSSTDDLLRVDLDARRRRRRRRAARSTAWRCARSTSRPRSARADGRTRRRPPPRPRTGSPRSSPSPRSTASAPPRAPSCSSACWPRGRPRLIASSIDLADLLALIAPSPPPEHRRDRRHRPARPPVARPCSARSARSGSTCSASPTSATTTTSSRSAATR